MSSFLAQCAVTTRDQCNAQDPAAHRWLALTDQQWMQYATLAAASLPVPPLDEVFKVQGRVKRIVLDIDRPLSPGEDASQVQSALIRAWASAPYSNLFKRAVPQTQLAALHSLWWSASRADKVSLKCAFPMLGHDDLAVVANVVAFLSDQCVPIGERRADLEVYATAQLRLPLSPKPDGQHAFALLGEYDYNGNAVTDFASRYGNRNDNRPPWRKEGKQPSLIDLFCYSTVINYCASTSIGDKLGQGAFSFSDRYCAFRRSLHPVNLDSHPIFNYLAAPEPRISSIDMRTSDFWDPEKGMAKVAELVFRHPVEPYADAVNFLNNFFALATSGDSVRLFCKQRLLDKDMEEWSIRLVPIASPAGYFKEIGGDMLMLPAPANRALFPKAKPDAPFNFFEWYLAHRHGIRRVHTVAFRPDPPGHPLREGVINTFQGFRCSDWRAEDVNLSRALGSHNSHLNVILRHVRDVFCSGDEKLASNIHHSVAHMLRKPWVKLPRAAILNGSEGTGKSLYWVEFVGKRLMGQGKHWMVTYNVDDLTGQWTEHLGDKNLVILEESDLGATNVAGTAKLQQLTSGDYMMLREKYTNNKMGGIWFMLVMLTNLSRPLAPTKSNRRFVFHPCDEDVDNWPADKYTAYFQRLVAAMGCDVQPDDEGPKQYYAYLLSLDIDSWSQQIRVRQKQSIPTVLQMIQGTPLMKCSSTQRLQACARDERTRRCSGCGRSSTCRTWASARCSRRMWSPAPATSRTRRARDRSPRSRSAYTARRRRAARGAASPTTAWWSASQRRSPTTRRSPSRARRSRRSACRSSGASTPSCCRR